MPLNRIRDTYSSDKDQALKTAKFQLQFIGENLPHLRKVDKKGIHERNYLDIESRIKRGEDLTPNTMNYIDSLYEKIWKGADYPSMNTHIDKKRTGLRFGKMSK